MYNRPIGRHGENVRKKREARNCRASDFSISGVSILNTPIELKRSALKAHHIIARAEGPGIVKFSKFDKPSKGETSI
jgi:hypothetical protein